MMIINCLLRQLSFFFNKFENYKQSLLEQVKIVLVKRFRQFYKEDNIKGIYKESIDREMSQEQQKDKDHSQFIAVLTARIAAFMNQMTEYCLQNLQNGPQKRPSKKKQPSEQSSSSNLQNDMTKGEQQHKRKFYKARNRLPINADSERPKAPTSSFLIYYHENKLKLGQKYGQTNVSKLTKLASQEWRSLPQQQRQKYLKMSQQSKYRYQKEMEIFKTKYADQIQQAMKKRRAEYRNTWMTKKKALLAKQKQKQEMLYDNSSLQFSQRQEEES